MESVPRSSEGSDPIRVDSVADLAYGRIRGYVLGGEVPPGARLGQVELAERFGISRTPVREALRRLAGEGLVDFHSNRGFRVADLGLDAVLRRMEVRSLVEPGIARLAAGRRTEEDVRRLQEVIASQEEARDGISAHDASRDFHMALARASGNEELVRVLNSLWLVEVGRRLLARRTADPNWLHDDVSEHRGILAAVKEGHAAEAERLMAEHIGRAVHHWEPLGSGGPGGD
ncbi:MAG TPA: GntR family transcriptional regulator [Rubrobacter sp.]|nr:GntR family transcriptional regulator [Rubrobacter sp.]